MFRLQRFSAPAAVTAVTSSSSSAAITSTAAAATFAVPLLSSTTRTFWQARFTKTAADSQAKDARDSSQTTGPDRQMPAGFTGGGEGSRHPGAGTPISAGAARSRAQREATESMLGGSIGIRSSTPPTTMPPWARLGKICRREVAEEQRRPHRPPYPKVPLGWHLHHTPGTNYFTMNKRVSASDARGGTSIAGGVADEEMRIFASGEIKEPEFTFRADDGEREEPEHMNWCVFISKPFKGQKSAFWRGGRRAPEEGAAEEKKGETDSSSASADATNGNDGSGDGGEIGAFNGGGMEFSLTTIDHELILDSIAIHDTADKLGAAWRARLEGPKMILQRDKHYRGPYIGELEEEFVDEILNYLDERGINNSFAEYVQAQWHWFEQAEYEEWLRMLMAFSTPKQKSAAAASTAAAPSSGSADANTAEQTASANATQPEGKA